MGRLVGWGWVVGEAQGEYSTNGILVQSTLPKLAIGACQGVEVARALN